VHSTAELLPHGRTWMENNLLKTLNLPILLHHDN
jgi:hypothetical protein